MENTDSVLEEKLWSDAYLIAYFGASNPRGVSRTFTQYIDAGFRLDHPAMRGILGHLAFLLGQGLGPEVDDITLIRKHQEGKD